MSIPEQRAETLKQKKKKMEKIDKIESLDSIEDEAIDKITPLAFTTMVLKNKIGGFSCTNMFSDLRYTLI